MSRPTQRDELPGMWEAADFLGGRPDVTRGSATSTDPTLHCFREDDCGEHGASITTDVCCCCGHLPEAHAGCDCES